ncbi:hypothetical protein D3C84_924670 [compost metagenome]
MSPMGMYPPPLTEYSMAMRPAARSWFRLRVSPSLRVTVMKSSAVLLPTEPSAPLTINIAVMAAVSATKVLRAMVSVLALPPVNPRFLLVPTKSAPLAIQPVLNEVGVAES